MKKLFLITIVQLLLAYSPAAAVSEEQALSVLRRAVPPAQEGWIVAGETRTDAAAVPKAPGTALSRVRYAISYKRVARLREDRKQLDTIYAESSRRNQEAVKPQIDELIRQQTVTSLALRKAARRRNAAEEKRLNDELEENGARMRALHEEVDQKVAREVAPYLLRDAEAGISIVLNEEAAELPFGETVTVKGSAFAVYRPGAPVGAAGWKEGELLVLYGDWRSLGNSVFRARVPAGAEGQVCSIRISITGEQARADRLLKQLDLKALLSLMQ